MTNPISLVDISIEPIELCKLLKIANMVGGGGEAKIVISEGYVLLNDEVEYQKRKKVYHDDIIEFNGETIQVNFIQPEDNHQTKLQSEVLAKTTKIKSTNSARANKSQTCSLEKSAPSPVVQKTKRKPISF